MSGLIFPVFGMHTSGKSSLLAYASGQGVLVFPEIAQQFINSGVKLAGNAGADTQRMIMNKEIERDKELAMLSRKAAIFVETWHIGNLAHCMITSPDLFTEYLKYFKKFVSRVNIHGIYLKLNSDEVFRRTRLHQYEDPSEVARFHGNVGANIERILVETGIPYSVVDANRDFNDVKVQFVATYKASLAEFVQQERLSDTVFMSLSNPILDFFF